MRRFCRFCRLCPIGWLCLIHRLRWFCRLCPIHRLCWFCRLCPIYRLCRVRYLCPIYRLHRFFRLCMIRRLHRIRIDRSNTPCSACRAEITVWRQFLSALTTEFHIHLLFLLQKTMILLSELSSCTAFDAEIIRRLIRTFTRHACPTLLGIFHQIE